MKGFSLLSAIVLAAPPTNFQFDENTVIVGQPNGAVVYKTKDDLEQALSGASFAENEFPEAVDTPYGKLVCQNDRNYMIALGQYKWHLLYSRTNDYQPEGVPFKETVTSTIRTGYKKMQSTLNEISGSVSVSVAAEASADFFFGSASVSTEVSATASVVNSIMDQTDYSKEYEESKTFEFGPFNLTLGRTLYMYEGKMTFPGQTLSTMEVRATAFLLPETDNVYMMIPVTVQGRHKGCYRPPAQGSVRFFIKSYDDAEAVDLTGAKCTNTPPEFTNQISAHILGANTCVRVFSGPGCSGGMAEFGDHTKSYSSFWNDNVESFIITEKVNNSCSFPKSDGIVNDSYDTNGWNLDYCGYKGGSFIRANEKGWIEYSPKGYNFFIETGRDDWSVYLYDYIRKLSIQLDVWRATIYYQFAGQPRGELYSITDRWTERDVKGSNVDAIQFESVRHSISIVDGMWFNSENSVVYEEIYRNADLVYLKGPTDSFIMDIPRMQIQELDGTYRRKIVKAYKR
jgi:hypothetical protein